MATSKSGAWDFVCSFLFKAWKWVVHLVSGTSEIERICKYPEIVTRTVFLSEFHCIARAVTSSGARTAVCVLMRALLV